MNLARELRAILGEADAVIDGDDRRAAPYLVDATESRAIRGRARAVVLPTTASDVAAVLGWCYAHDVPLVPRGGGTGYAGGAVPVDGEVVVGLERLAAAPRFEPQGWRVRTPAGVRTADLARRARETGLWFPPDPGAAESSTIGGNVATNAGGPHTFKYGVTGAWVTGLEVVLAPGELVEIGGRARKDVGGYDLRSLLVGSEGTLGIVTGAWLRLIPPPPVALPLAGLYPDAATGCAALAAVLAEGVVPAALEFLDAGALGASAEALAGVTSELDSAVLRRTGFMLLAEADGSMVEAGAVREAVRDAMSDGALAVLAPTEPRDIAALWRWRSGVSLSVIARRGGKLSEDIVVPVERLAEAIERTLELGARHGLSACSWGHAGDGNLHATFTIDPGDAAEVAHAEAAAQELFAYAASLGGAVSGEHGLGVVKRGALGLQWQAPALRLHAEVKRVFDPKGLINPHKKLAGEPLPLADV